MNYELAKELKDAGFPLREYGVAQRAAGLDGFTVEEAWGETSYLYPALSELIAACDGFHILEQFLDCWEARALNGGAGKGTIPEEAVARLYISLNNP